MTENFATDSRFPALNRLNFSGLCCEELEVLLLEATGNGLKSSAATSLLHKHAFFELHIALKGGILYEFEDKTVTVKENEFLIVCPEIKHRICSAEKEFSRISLSFNLTENSPLYENLMKMGHFYSKLSPLASSSIDFILDEAVRNNEYSKKICVNRLYEILCILLGGNKPPSEVKRSAPNNHIEMAKKYIDDNPQHFFNCEDVSEYCNLSTKQLGRIFNSHENVSLLQYIHRQKINQAKKMLEQSDAPISEISSSLGFNNEIYFNSFFKRLTGTTPGKFKKGLNKLNIQEEQKYEGL